MAEKKQEQEAPAGAGIDAFEAAQERGFFGVETDKTPNENYTLRGVAAGKPTPETSGE